MWMKCLFLAEAEVHSLLAAVQLCSRQILGVLTAVPPGSLACRHLHGLCWHEVCIHRVCTAMDLGVPPSACPGSQRWGCVLYVLQHGMLMSCASAHSVSSAPQKHVRQVTDLLSSHASYCWHQAKVKSTSAQFSAKSPFPY